LSKSCAQKQKQGVTTSSRKTLLQPESNQANLLAKNQNTKQDKPKNLIKPKEPGDLAPGSLIVGTRLPGRF